MEIRAWKKGFGFFLVFGSLACVEPARDSSLSICPLGSIKDSLLGFQELCRDTFYLSDGNSSEGLVAVTEGDDVSLQMMLNLVYGNSNKYASVLFHASWCPFSRSFRPAFAIMSSLYPSIPHFAVEESAISPRTLSMYGVHGFPTLFLLNSTMRVSFHGARTLNSLAAYYANVTGVKPVLQDQMSLEEVGSPLILAKLEDTKLKIFDFSWARSPENLLWHEATCLVLATAFVLLRLLYFLFPSLLAHARFAWRRHILNSSLMSLLEHPLAYLHQATWVFNELKKPCKRNNLQEGAMNAKAWASKSLASVSIGDPSSSKGGVLRSGE